MNQLPKILREIYRQVQADALPASNLPEFMADWHLYTKCAQASLRDLTVEDDGKTMTLGTCSPGCQACKSGTWDCIFLTMQCNLSCPFCYSPHGSSADQPESAFGRSREQITAAYVKTAISGVSFSGGEPFSHPDELVSWVTWARGLLPKSYLWVYTNGTQVQQETLNELARAGLDEIRFNMAATGYSHPQVMDAVYRAAGQIPAVTVEIPAIPRDAEKLLGSLSGWVEAGVSFLNLHELLYEPGTPAEHMRGERIEVRLPDGHLTVVDPGSRDLVLSVMETITREGLKLPVNHCSLANKVRQVRGRRRSMLPFTQAPFEKLTGEDLLESYILYSGEEQTIRCGIEQLAGLQGEHAGWKVVRVARTAPLAVQDVGRWVVYEEI